PPHVSSISLNLVVVIVCPPTRHALFPYTTLFRSPSALIWRASRTARSYPVFRPMPNAAGAQRSTSDRRSCPCSKVSFAQGQLLRDRKSTRLNSSHVASSYAVFCLKKKTTLTNRPW